ncbi:Panacea domain-containing protein [Candidatus Liberibacter brunswickensis]|uniref:hypothetical protein n=1 Tax=Candidatus Liberibacter brunswickensis TaxID=1968796 RepID=UPI002FE3A8ED
MRVFIIDLKYFGNADIKVPIDLAFQLFPIIKDDYVINEMEYIWEKYQYHSADQLSDITHQPERAWKKCYDPDNPLNNKTITVEDILSSENRY